MRIGTDTGGTFTDVVTERGEVAKVPSTPDDQARAVREGAHLVGHEGHEAHERVTTLAHGTTVATNAVLERRGATVALITNAGFEDVIEIARQDRPSLYDQAADRPVPLVPRALRFGVAGRLDARGAEIEPVDVGALERLPGDIDSVAVCLLHSDIDAAHEQAVGVALRAAGHDVTISSELCPEMREYERTSTVVLNAYLRPLCRSYLGRLVDVAPEVLVLTSAGGLIPAADAAEEPARLLLSGPAGGAMAGAAIAAANGFPDAVTFDMGGTSTDVCLVLDGRPAPAAERDVGGFPVRLPSLDIHTVGAGGGSLASIDAGGALVVGPRSAGAVPGPACYRRGGTLPTVTDADLVLGRIPTGHAFPGLGTLDGGAAASALARAGVTAHGVVTVVNVTMEQAIRRVSVEKGVDPAGLALVAFGGAGPLHACDLADALGMPAVIIPPRAGVLSAVGVLAAPRTVDLVRTWGGASGDAGLRSAVGSLVDDASRRLDGGTGLGGPSTSASLDCRYVGQGHALRVPWTPDWRRSFEAVHRRVKGFALEAEPVEVVAVRATAKVASPVAVLDLPEPQRSVGLGPCVLAETDCTIWVPEGWRAQRGAAGALVLRRTTS